MGSFLCGKLCLLLCCDPSLFSFFWSPDIHVTTENKCWSSLFCHFITYLLQDYPKQGAKWKKPKQFKTQTKSKNADGPSVSGFPFFHSSFILSSSPSPLNLIWNLCFIIWAVPHTFKLWVLFPVSLEELGWIHSSLAPLLVPAKLETLFEKVFSWGVTSQGKRKKALLASQEKHSIGSWTGLMMAMGF